jgi:hypothetical protein
MITMDHETSVQKTAAMQKAAGTATSDEPRPRVKDVDRQAGEGDVDGPNPRQPHFVAVRGARDGSVDGAGQLAL